MKNSVSTSPHHEVQPHNRKDVFAWAFLRGFMSYADVFATQPVRWRLCRSFLQDHENLRNDFVHAYVVFSKQNLSSGKNFSQLGLQTAQTEKDI